MTEHTLSQLFSRMVYRVHPKLGAFYDKYQRFFNDQFVELVGLIIANLFVGWLSFYFVGLSLVLVLLVTATPVTVIVKYLMRKHWVWR